MTPAMLRAARAAICATLMLWTVSGAAAHPGAARRVLSVGVVGGGQVTTNDGRIDCGPRCSASYRKGSVRRLAALPREGFEFEKWSGDCIGTAPICDIALDRRQHAVASFLGKPTLVRLSVGGPGRILSPEAAITCGGATGDCGAVVPHGTNVTLTPEAAANGRFAGWDGPCAAAGTGPCTLTIVNDVEVAAAFGHSSPAPGEQPLTVTRYGAYVQVTSQPAGIDCPPACNASFPSGTLVTLTLDGLSRWAGGCWGFLPRCRLVVDSPTNVAAATPPPPPVPFAGPAIPPPPRGGYLDVTVSGKGLVTAGRIQCGRAPNPRVRCRDFLPLGDTYVLHAALRRGTYFARWGGDCRGKKRTCRIAIPDSGSPTYAVTGLFRAKP